MTHEACPRSPEDGNAVLEEIRSGSRRALARAVTWLEQGDPRGTTLLAEARRQAGANTQVGRMIGLTGAPGSGKSSLIDQLVAYERKQGHRVAVLAVDPSSPYSGGAILGDRIRMMRWHDDPDVYLRSLASRGQLGGLASGVLRAASFLAAVGFSRILIETVGVGQSEVDIVHVADTTIVVFTPGAGDGVQAFKAGVNEIADVFVINKADLPGAEQLRTELQAAQRLVRHDPDAWLPPILLTQASQQVGIEELHAACEDHARHLVAHDAEQAKAHLRAQAEIEAALREHIAGVVRADGGSLAEAVLLGECTAEEAAQKLLRTQRG